MCFTHVIKTCIVHFLIICFVCELYCRQLVICLLLIVYPLCVFFISWLDKVFCDLISRLCLTKLLLHPQTFFKSKILIYQWEDSFLAVIICLFLGYDYSM